MWRQLQGATSAPLSRLRDPDSPEGGIAHFTLLWPGEELPVVDPQWVAYGDS